MKKAWMVFVVVAAIASPALAQTWSGFEWAPVTQFGREVKRGLIYLRVQVQGMAGAYRMVLDTRLSGTLFYGKTLRELPAARDARLPAPAQSGRTRMRGTWTIGQFKFEDVLAHIDESLEGPPTPDGQAPVIGAVGLDLMQQRVWIVDYPRARFSVLDPGAAMPKAFEGRVSYFGAIQRDSRLFMTVATSGPVGDFLFDTTCSLFPLLTTKPLWQKMTGRYGDEKNLQKIEVKGDGTSILFQGSRTLEPIVLGGRPLGRAVAFTMVSGPDAYRVESWPFASAGAIGNQPFSGSTLIIDLAQNRMGIVGQRRN